MSRTIQFKRRIESEVANTVGANGEIIIDTTNNTLTIHNGVLPGGHRLASESYVDGIAAIPGPQGPQGPQGEQGIQGEVIITSYIFDGGTPSSSYTQGPAFDCGGVN
jgi:hypothetical protein